jgi:hypothetical protein
MVAAESAQTLPNDKQQNKQNKRTFNGGGVRTITPKHKDIP